MAARFIDIDDFIGFYKIDENLYDSDIVEKTEESVLRDLLGNTLYTEFINDLDGSNEPQTQKWKDFKDGKDYTDSILINYVGISEMLVAFCFYALILDNYESSSTGFTKNLNQNSRVFNEHEKKALAYKSYNKGVNFYTQSEKFIEFYSTSFENWYHKTKSYKHLIDY